MNPPCRLAQTSADKTNGRFPLAICEKASFSDGVLRVQFEPVSGTVDQAAGLLWRYRDPDDYLVLAQKAVEAARALLQAQENSIRAAQASAEALRELEGYLHIRAPFSGVITERFAHPGALVGPAARPLLRLEQLSTLRLVVAVPEAEMSGIVAGARVAFSVPAYPGQSFSGVVARIARALDAKTRTMPVELDVRNPDQRLAPGIFPEADWPVRRAQPSLLAPPSSIVTTTERTFVIPARQGRAEYVTIRRGAPAGELIEVYGSLGAGDTIVRRGSDEIREGTPLIR